MADDQNPPVPPNQQNQNVVPPQQPAQTLAQFFENAINDEGIRNQAGILRQRIDRTRQFVPEMINLQDVDLPAEALKALVLTYINGSARLPEQKVNVEYIRQEQRLIIPSALGMHILPNGIGRCAGIAVLRERYHKLQDCTYAILHNFIAQSRTAIQIREYVDGRNAPNPPVRKMDWFDEPWFTRANGIRDDAETAIAVFAYVSQRLQFNCDFRDFGFLNTDNGSTQDGAWSTAHEVEMPRLRCGLQAFSLQSIAALNFVPVGRYALTAWSRAYGLAFGLLPSLDSNVTAEYNFTVAQPAHDSLVAVVNYQTTFQGPMPTLCLNIIAMFGLLHLNKDHTYKPDDVAMERIGTSYMRTLRTGIDDKQLDELANHKESVMRTCAHPFGLGQTYWLALAMAKHGLLMPPLSIRVNTCPPPVQRLLIVHATAAEWEALPTGSQVSGVYRPELIAVERELTRVYAQPPAFSGLHRYYGIPQQSTIGLAADRAIGVLMPAVYGYIHATHVSDRNERDGLALAQSLKNVERDQKGVVTFWTTAWEKYLVDLDKQGLAEFIVTIAGMKIADQGENAAIGG